MTAGPRITTAILAAAILLRAPGLFTDFWLDEIWALRTMESVHAVAEIFNGIHRDVNHYLISLWMFGVGLTQPFWLYRLPSLVAGAVAVVAAGRVASLERGNPTLAMLFVAVSAPLVIYSSEARGYAIAAAASMTALFCLLQYLRRRRFGWLAGYWAAMALGVLGHLSFVFLLGPTTAVLLLLLLRDRITPGLAALVQSVPAALLAGLFLIDLRYLQLAGGQPRTFSELVAQSGAIGLGSTAKGWSVWLFGGACAVLLIVELRRRIREWQMHDEWRDTRLLVWTFCVTAFLFPLVVVAMTRQSHFYPRYLLVSLVFVPLLIASLAGRLPRRWRSVFVTAFFVVNLTSVAQFWRHGRGAYDEALAAVLQTSTKPAVTISSDYPLNRLVVEFYRDRMTNDAERLQYVDTAADAEFWIASEDRDDSCTRCERIGVYQASTVAGVPWIVYRRSR